MKPYYTLRIHPLADHPAANVCEQPFGANLESSLRRACGDRLSAISWFRTDWQRGGALTGYATYRDDTHCEQPVVVKLPVGPTERHWLIRLSQEQEGIAPHLWADGQVLGDYDIAWIVMERLPYGPLSGTWQGHEFDLLIEAAGRFYTATQPFPADEPPIDRDWEAMYQLARQSVHRHQLDQEQRWNRTLKKAQKKLKSWQHIWDERPMDQWCHGDLHLANAMTRHAPPNGPAVLLDLASVHRGHWVEDAIYFEHLYWGHRDRIGGRQFCGQMARQLKRLGLTVAKDWQRSASALRLLLAMSAPAKLRRSGDRKHVLAALEVLETEMDKT